LARQRSFGRQILVGVGIGVLRGDRGDGLAEDRLERGREGTPDTVVEAERDAVAVQ
jgi:hypothetical protein